MTTNCQNSFELLKDELVSKHFIQPYYPVKEVSVFFNASENEIHVLRGLWDAESVLVWVYVEATYFVLRSCHVFFLCQARFQIWPQTKISLMQYRGEDHQLFVSGNILYRGDRDV